MSPDPAQPVREPPNVPPPTPGRPVEPPPELPPGHPRPEIPTPVNDPARPPNPPQEFPDKRPGELQMQDGKGGSRHSRRTIPASAIDRVRNRTPFREFYLSRERSGFSSPKLNIRSSAVR